MSININEELSTDELNAVSHYLGVNANNLEKLSSTGNIFPQKSNINENMQNAYLKAKQAIIDLDNSFRLARESSEVFRKIVRASGNTIKGFQEYIKDNPDKEKIIRKLITNNTYDNFIRLPLFIKGIRTLNKARMASTHKNMYRDFTKEINELEVLYNNFLSKKTGFYNY